MGSQWWGDFQFKQTPGLEWKIGPLDLQVERLSNEWRVCSGYSRHFLEDVVETTELKSADIENLDVLRFSARKEDFGLRVVPMLADRPIVARPETPFYVPAGDEIFVYISSPLWLQLKVRRGETKLYEVPSFRISDTWFGPSTINGELCYATKTHARLCLEDLPFRPYRAITAVKIDNNTSEPLLVNRIKIPIPNLSLFTGRDGSLWTESMKFQMETGNDIAKVNMYARPHESAGKVTIVSPPRKKTDRNLVMRAFSNIF